MRAILLNISAFVADNHVRRNVLSATLNHAVQSYRQETLTVSASSSYSYTCSGTQTNVLMIRTTAPLSATLAYRSAPTVTFQMNVRGVLVLDSNIATVVLNNTGTQAATVHILQG